MNYYLVSKTFICKDNIAKAIDTVSTPYVMRLGYDTKIKPIVLTNDLYQSNHISDDPINQSDDPINQSDVLINQSDVNYVNTKTEMKTLGAKSIYFIKDICISAIDFDNKQIKGDNLINLNHFIWFCQGKYESICVINEFIKCFNADNNIHIDSEIKLEPYLDMKQLKLKFDILSAEIKLYSYKKFKQMDIKVILGEFPHNSTLNYNPLHPNITPNIKTIAFYTEFQRGIINNKHNMNFSADFDYLYIHSKNDTIDPNNIYLYYIGYQIDFTIKKLDTNGKMWKLILPTTFSALASFTLDLKTQTDSLITVVTKIYNYKN
jgi:hypothetical protein